MWCARGCNNGWIRIGALAAVLALAGGCKRGELSGVEQSAPLIVETVPEDSDAEVYVDGNYVGIVRALNVPETGPVLLAPGIHRVEIRKPGRFPIQLTVTVKKDRNGPVVLRAELLEDPS
jgi:hypothetical protein